MILESLVGVSLVISVAVNSDSSPGAGQAPTLMSAQQKHVIMEPLVRSATECVLRAVTNDQRTVARLGGSDLSELIVASMPTCADHMRAMIDAHDQLYGAGSGEKFFMGPYLDRLPEAVSKAVKEIAQ
jgi:hypothetical protein